MNQSDSRGSTPRISMAAGVLITGMLVPVASASISVSDPFLSLTATSSLGTGTVTVPIVDVSVFNDVDFDVWFWGSAGPVDILDGDGDVIGTLGNMTVLCGRNTQVDGTVRWGIDIDFQLGAGAADTEFLLTSPLLSFAGVDNASATSSAGLVGTDQNSNGITLTPEFSSILGSHGFQSMVNGSIFREYLFSTLTNGPAQSVNDQGNMVPAGSFSPVGTVTSIQFMYNFSATAGDTAGGTAQISIVPAPGTLGLIGIGSLVALRRRR